MKKLQTFQKIIKNWRVLFPKWINPDELKHTDNHLEQHSKINRLLKVRGFKDGSKQHKSSN